MQTEALKAEPPKRKRRWFQFSLRTLFLAMTILAVQCAVCFPALKEWQAQPDTWSNAGGTGTIAPFQTNIVCHFGHIVCRKPRAMRRYSHPHMPAASAVTQS
jgi:hypothetical protein